MSFKRDIVELLPHQEEGRCHVCFRLVMSCFVRFVPQLLLTSLCSLVKVRGLTKTISFCDCKLLRCSHRSVISSTWRFSPEMKTPPNNPHLSLLCDSSLCPFISSPEGTYPVYWGPSSLSVDIIRIPVNPVLSLVIKLFFIPPPQFSLMTSSTVVLQGS